MVVRLSYLLSPLFSLAAAIEPATPQDLPFDPVGDASKFQYVLHIPDEYINDHSLIFHAGEWHLYFIRGAIYTPPVLDSNQSGMKPPGTDLELPQFDVQWSYADGWTRNGNEIQIGHAVSRDLVNWSLLPAALTVGPTGSIDAGHVYAPAVIRKDSLFYMIYTATDGAHFRAEHLCMATSPDLHTWTRWGDTAIFRPDSSWARYYDPAKVKGRPGPISGRDPHIVYDERYGYLCYYVARLKGDPNMGITDEELACVAVASSPDMITWTDRGPVLIRPIRGIDYNTWTHPESPCVIKKDGRWYLFWKGGSGTRAVSSTDPFDFSSRETYFVGTSHASKVVPFNSRWFVTSCSRLVDDYMHSRSDRTRGLYLATLGWRAHAPLLESLPARVADSSAIPEPPASLVLERGDPLVIPLGRSEVRDVRVRIVDAAGCTVSESRPELLHSGDGACQAVIPSLPLQSGFYLVVAEHTGGRSATRLVVR